MKPATLHQHPIINAQMNDPATFFKKKSDNALALYSQGMRAEALKILTEMKNELPNNAEVRGTISVILHELNKNRQALRYANDAIRLAKNRIPELYTNRGNIFRALGFYPAALQDHYRTIRLKPLSHHAWINLGCCQLDLQDLDVANEAFERALLCDPTSHEVRFNTGNLKLVTTNCIEGWQDYEHRLWMPEGPEFKPKYPWPLWKGENLEGKRILVHCEQGHGDSIHFARYLLHLSYAGASRILVGCPQNLLGLFQYSFPFTDCFTGDLKISNMEIDYHVYMMSLPTYTTGGPFWEYPYLKSSNSQSLYLSDRPKIGIAWAGNPLHRNDPNRSMPQETMMEFVKQFPECDFYSLQKERVNEKLLLQNKITKLSLTDFQATANYIDALDFVVSVDTSVAHLSGAFGKSTILLIPHSPDWRYGLTDDKCIWYPNHKIFRQSSRGDWRKVTTEATAYLKDKLKCLKPMKII